MAYGPDFNAVFRRAASLTDRILRGARPTDLPIERPTKFHLNRATAWALNIELPTAPIGNRAYGSSGRDLVFPAAAGYVQEPTYLGDVG
jgi:ABC-type uncharacterized transport system substrate-binding protein